MTNKEFSQEMDVIYENINKGGAVGLDPYEKSVILTTAQEKLVQSLVATSPEAIPTLVRTLNVPVSVAVVNKIDERAFSFELPDGYLAILNERAVHHTNANPTLAQKVFYSIVPLAPMEYTAIQAKPYGYPPRRTAWRLVNSGENVSEEVKAVEILGRPGKTLNEYRVTYVAMPRPIILETLENGDTIRGLSAETTTNLLESLHPAIVEFAVTLAEQYYYDKYNTKEAPKQ